jgi:hypothetical protein
VIAITKLIKYNTDGTINIGRSIDAAKKRQQTMKPNNFGYKSNKVNAAIALLEKYGYTVTKEPKK